jgi:hypothetical protein
MLTNSLVRAYWTIGTYFIGGYVVCDNELGGMGYTGLRVWVFGWMVRFYYVIPWLRTG